MQVVQHDDGRYRMWLRSHLVLLVALTCGIGLALVTLAAAAGTGGGAGTPDGRVLGTHALAGPVQTPTQIAWLEERNGYYHVAVRTASNLSGHDLIPHWRIDGVNVGPYEFAWGAGRAFWVDTQCGNNCYESVFVVGADSKVHGAPDRVPNDSGADYITGGNQTGPTVVASAGDANLLVYSEIIYDIDPVDRKCGEGGPCNLVITGAKLWGIMRRGGWTALPARWPVDALAVRGLSLAMAQADGDAIDVVSLDANPLTMSVLSVPEWQIELQLHVPGATQLSLSPSRLAVLTKSGTVFVYDISSGKQLVKIDTGTKNSQIAVSSEALAVGVAGHILVIRPNGSRTSIATRGMVEELSIAGRRLAWSNGGVIRMLVLPKQ